MQYKGLIQILSCFSSTLSPFIHSLKHYFPPDSSDPPSDAGEERDTRDRLLGGGCVVYVSPRGPNTSTVEEIPAKEPHPMSAMPKKSALKKKAAFTCADFQRMSIVKNRYGDQLLGKHTF